MNPKNYRYGFLTIELSVIILLTALTVTWLYPKGLSEKLKITSYKNRMIRTINQARLTAFLSNKPTIICPINANNECIDNWHADNVACKQGNKTIFISSMPSIQYSSWKASLNNSQQIVFRPNGSTDGEQGRLTIGCRDNLPCYGIIINFSGNVSSQITS